MRTTEPMTLARALQLAADQGDRDCDCWADVAAVGAVTGEELERAWDDAPYLCSECGEDASGGEGYDGLCGNCADRAYVENRWGDFDGEAT